MTAEDPDVRYWALIDAAIVRTAGTSPSLAELCQRLPGLYPADLVNRLDKLHDLGVLSDDMHARLRTYKPVPQDSDTQQSVLPLPHPLDYEWRFTSASADDLLDRIARFGATRVALLGTPFLAERASVLAPNYEIDLFERRIEACEPIRAMGRVKVHCIDLTNFDGAADTFDVIVADPPWYPATIDIFMHAASNLLKVGGVFMIAGPALGTRPSIAAERIRATEFADRNGLVVSDLSSGSLRYASPPFEQCALQAGGLGGLPIDWRRGDLYTFIKTGDPHPFTADVDVSAGVLWEEIALDRIRIRVRRDAPAEALPLTRLVDGDVLDSVSRRDERRSKANVMTTANCIYRTADPAQLLASLQAIANQSGEPAASPAADDYAAAAVSIVERDRALLGDLGLA